MAQLTRSEIIAEARIQAGRQSESITLDKAFDRIIQGMSKDFPILSKVETGSLTADQNYIDLPADYRSQRMLDVGGKYTRRYSSFKVGDNWLRFLSNPADFYYWDQTDYGDPVIYMIEATPRIYKVYFYPKKETETPAYSFNYHAIHEKSWPTWAGLSAKTDISFTASSKTIASVAAEFVIDACRTGREITIAGSASNDGTYTIVSATTAAVVVSETLVDEAAGASVTVTVETEDDYYHLYGMNWDQVVIDGVAYRAARRIKEWQIASELRDSFIEGLEGMALTINKRPAPRVMYHHF